MPQHCENIPSTAPDNTSEGRPSGCPVALGWLVHADLMVASAPRNTKAAIASGPEIEISFQGSQPTLNERKFNKNLAPQVGLESTN